MGQSHDVDSKDEVEGEDKGEAGIVSDSPSFDSWLGECITNIIESPRDASVLALFSKSLELAVNSDIVWETFLPQDYKSLVPLWREFSSKKELYFSLCDNPVPINDGEKRLWLDKTSGKRCIILPAMDLIMAWGHDLRYWHWYQIPEARFGKLAKLIEVCWFDIRGRMNTRLLSPATRYSAYIVFKKVDDCEGFLDIPIEARIKKVGKEPSRRLICFDEAMSRRKKRNIVKPEEREDGWMEVELGEFLTDEVLHSNEIEIRVLESSSLNWKQGLIILGIEIRPASNAESKDDSEVMKEIGERTLRVVTASPSENIKSGTYRTKQSCNRSGKKLGAIIGCLLLLYFCLPRFTITPLLSEGVGALNRIVMDVPKVLKYIPPERPKIAIDKDIVMDVPKMPECIPPERTEISIDKESDLLTCKDGAKIVRTSSVGKTNIDVLDRTLTNSPMDREVKPPQIPVFINFRGEQLRKNFVGYLVHALQRRKVNVFIDNLEQRGEDLNTLFKRIEDSGIAIVVFSTRYTESKWCLEELVKIKERVHQGLLKVLPIFYKVSPTDVKRLKGEFGDHFRDKEHLYGSDSPLIKAWKEAIVFVTHKFALTFDENSCSGALENDFVETIVEEVLKILRSVSIVESGQSSGKHLWCGVGQS